MVNSLTGEPSSSKHDLSEEVLCNVFGRLRMATNLATDLPEEVLCNIFRRLPMATLATLLRHVCRSWRALIESPSFSRAHPSSRPGVLIQVWASGGDTIRESMLGEYGKQVESEHERHHCAFIPATDGQPAFHILCDDFFSPGYLKVVHSCGGLLLLCRNDVPAIICNPLLRQWAPLPQDPLEDQVEGHAFFYDQVLAGMGFDAVAEVYKVFNFVYADERISARVCTLDGGNSEEWEWRAPAGGQPAAKFELQNNGCGYVAGKLHWVSSDSKSLVVVDVQTEAFDVLPLPMLWNQPPCVVSVGTVADEKLSVRLRDARYHGAGLKGTEVWVMVEYGDPGSWVMIEGNGTWDEERKLQSNNWWLMLHWSGLVNDMDRVNWRKYTYPSGQEHNCPRVVLYNPTLVWPETNPNLHPRCYQEVIQGSLILKNGKLYEFNPMWPPLRCSCGSFLALLKREEEYPFRNYYLCERPNCNNFIWANQRREHRDDAPPADEIATLKYENVILRKQINYLMRRLGSIQCLFKEVNGVMAEDRQNDNKAICSPYRKSSEEYEDCWDVGSKISRFMYQEEKQRRPGCDKYHSYSD